VGESGLHVKKRASTYLGCPDQGYDLVKQGDKFLAV
jgi:hypothetical protein